MSNHKTPLTSIEREGLIAHGLGRYIGKPSQLADVFRQGVAWAQQAATDAALERAAEECFKHRSAEEAAEAIRALKGKP